MSAPTRDSLRQVDDSSWLVGQKLILLRSKHAGNPLWKDGHGNSFTLVPLTGDLPPTIVISPGSFPRLVHDCANVSAVWDFGDAVLKIKRFQRQRAATRENVTLDWLATQQLDFPVPRALHYSEDDDRSYLFTTRLPGVTLNSAWPSLTEDEIRSYVQQVVEICVQLSALSSAKMGGVDGSQIPDAWLDTGKYDFRTENLVSNCRQLGMSCDEFFFSHNDLAASNIMVDPQGKHEHPVGIIDWELSGFVPREWISTKFAVGWGLDLELEGGAGPSDSDWRRRVHQALGEKGFPDVSDNWDKWSKELCASK